MTARAHHPYLDPPDASWSERVSDADPAQQGTVILGNGRVAFVLPPGSIPHQLTQARNSRNAATRDVQAAHQRGRRPMNDELLCGQTAEEAYRDEKAGMYDY